MRDHNKTYNEMKKVLGFGNALVDILITPVSENMLTLLELPKGSMTLIDEKQVDIITKNTSLLTKKMMTGGSAANTINGLSNLGVETALIAKIGDDEVGDFFKNDLLSNNIVPYLGTSSTPAGRSYVLITKDSERTFGTFLGASIELTASDVLDDWFTGYHYFYVEGYLVQNHALIEAGMKKAKAAGLKVVLDLASYNVVDDNLEFLKHLVKTYVDIVFANEEEAKSYAQLEPVEALLYLSREVETAIVKIGAQGAHLKSAQEQVHVNANAVSPVDTTGAGDLYAAGVLYGLINDLTLKQSGEIGAILAGHVIEDFGAKMTSSTWDTIRQKVANIKNC